MQTTVAWQTLHILEEIAVDLVFILKFCSTWNDSANDSWMGLVLKTQILCGRNCGGFVFYKTSVPLLNAIFVPIFSKKVFHSSDWPQTVGWQHYHWFASVPTGQRARWAIELSIHWWHWHCASWWFLTHKRRCFESFISWDSDWTSKMTWWRT